MGAMNTAKILKIESSDLRDTLRLGATIGNHLRGGEVIELIGDLGSGKTALVRGIARGLGIDHEVSSPSFTITNLYQGDKLSISHYDFYRLHEAGVVLEELKESISDPNNVTIIEWSEVVSRILPSSRIQIKCSTTGENSRVFKILLPSNLDYLMEGLVV